jgi:DNA-binding MurR/RpiR family transcriptional regulator
MREDDCLALFRDALLSIIDKVMREQWTEIKALSTAVVAWKMAHPEQSPLIDQILETARHSEDIKRSVDAKIESILKILRSLDLSNLKEVSEALIRSNTQAT